VVAAAKLVESEGAEPEWPAQREPECGRRVAAQRGAAAPQQYPDAALPDGPVCPQLQLRQGEAGGSAGSLEHPPKRGGEADAACCNDRRVRVVVRPEQPNRAHRSHRLRQERAAHVHRGVQMAELVPETQLAVPADRPANVQTYAALALPVLGDTRA